MPKLRLAGALLGAVAALAGLLLAAVLPGMAGQSATGGATAALATLAGEVCPPVAPDAMGIVPDGLAAGPNGGFYVSVSDQVHSEVCHVSASGTVTLAAGDGTPGYLPAPYGDNTAATGAELYSPAGLAYAGGKLYIADRLNNRVRVVSSGIISTFAGSGAGGSPLSGTPSANEAILYRPSGVVVDSAGDVYVADSAANQVVEVETSGVVRVVAGTGVAGFSGDGGPATEAELDFPTALALGGNGDLYIADSGNNRVRMVSPSGTITTVAGTGVAGFSGDGGPATKAELDDPEGLAIGPHGSLYIADSHNQRIRKVLPTGIIETVIGNGQVGYTGEGVPGTSEALNYPAGVAVDSAGDVFVADDGECIVQELSASTGEVTTIAGWTPAKGVSPTCGFVGSGGTGMLNHPTSVAVDPGVGLVIADSLNNRVRLLSGVAF